MASRRRGGGAGTVSPTGLRVGRDEREHVVCVQEPVPGRVLRERARTSALVSTWTLTPGGEGERTVVRVAVGLRDPRISGWLARVRARRALRRLYGRLLERAPRANELSSTSARSRSSNGWWPRTPPTAR
jgi:hypothetical protein